MAWPPGKHIEDLIFRANQLLIDCNIIRHHVSLHRALIDLEGRWKDCRVILSEIHRDDLSVRYAYYVLDNEGGLIHGFDNSPDTQAIRLKYGAKWKQHLHEEIPHQHDANRKLALTRPL
jgi:hypothetical protein